MNNGLLAPALQPNPSSIPPGSALLEVRDLDIAYGDVQVVFGMNMHVNPQELVGLVGGNGSGKRFCAPSAAC
jgi:branched-chain amino acid transport system ATP-binding protein